MTLIVGVFLASEQDKYKGGGSMTDTEKKEFEELKERVKVLEDQIQILHAEYKKLSGFSSLNQKYR